MGCSALSTGDGRLLPVPLSRKDSEDAKGTDDRGVGGHGGPAGRRDCFRVWAEGWLRGWPARRSPRPPRQLWWRWRLRRRRWLRRWLRLWWWRLCRRRLRRWLRLRGRRVRRRLRAAGHRDRGPGGDRRREPAG